jgi:alkanesulfonate monooxygenase SsuD/methylene tetrahydromethanopterin reductase-like flavin-dependent oxidoreductase (luciferase family)
VDRFAEAMEVISGLIKHGRSDFTGTYHRTVDAPLLPAVPGRARPPILVGGRGPRMLGLIAKYADVWNVAWFGTPGEKFQQARERMLAACAERGRDPKTLQVSVGVYVKPPDAAEDAPGVVGEVEALADAIDAWRAEGVAEILFWMDPPTQAGLATLAKAMRR